MVINLQPKQITLYNAIKGNEHTIIGYGGSAGGAKSHGLRDVSLILSGEYPGIKIGFFRRVNKQLTSNHIIPFFQKYPELRQYFNKSEKILYYPNGSITRFVSSDLEDSIYDIQGDEFDIACVDEATHFTKIQLDFIQSRVRTTILPFVEKTVMSMNPGNISHAYIKRIFIDKVYEENEDANDYYFIPAKIYDNVIWSEKALKEQGYTIKQYYEEWTDEERMDFCYKYSQYAKRLSKLPEQLRRAYLEGDWDVFGGQFFKEFNKREQEIEPFEIPKEWNLIGALDPGYSSPCAFHLIAQDFNGNYYLVGTYYEDEKNPEQHAVDIKDFIESNKFTNGRYPSYIVSGLDAWAKKDRYAIVANELTLNDVFQRHGLNLTRANTSRIQGWWALKSLMPSRIFFFKGFCNDTITEIQSVISDDKKVEDIQGGGNDPNVADHALDALRYGIMAIYKPHEFKEKREPTGREEAASIQSENIYTNF